MRKSFTRLFSLFALFCVLGLQMVYGGVKDRVPKDEAVNVNPGSTTLSLTFDYPLEQGDNYTGAVIQLMNSNGTVAAITLPSPDFVIDGNVITLNFRSAVLKDLTNYWVLIPNKVVKEKKTDGTTPDFAGFVAPVATAPALDWNFTTGDFTAPKLAASNPFIPADGTKNVGSLVSSADLKSSTFTFTFADKATSTPETAVGVSGKYIKIYTAAGNIHEMIDAGRFTTAANSFSITTSNLRENSDYYILVDAGAFVDNSTAKNAFAGISDKTVWNFSTRDYTATVALADYPKIANVDNANFDVKVKVDEPAWVHYYVITKTAADALTSTPVVNTIATRVQSIDAETANTEYTKNITQYWNGSALVSIPTSTSSSDYVVYYYTVNKSKLLATGDYIVGDVIKLGDPIKTLDITAPTVTTLTPSNGATTVVQYLDGGTDTNHGTFSMEFSESVKAGTGNIILKKASDNSTVESVDITSSKVKFSDVGSVKTKLVSVAFAAKLESTTKYYVLIASGVITDQSGNKYGGISSATTWYFTTTDLVAPTVSFSSPANKNVLAKTEPVKITVSEDIYYGSPATLATTGADASSLVYVERNDVLQNGDFLITFESPTKIAIVPTGTAVAWKQNSTYVVKLIKNKVKDAAGNVIATEQKKSYNTDSYDAPIITTTTDGTYPSANPMSLANVSDNIIFRFSENVELLGGGAITSSNVGSLITLNENGAGPIDFVATYDPVTRNVTVNPVNDLGSSKSYTLNISTGYQDFNVLGAGANQGVGATATYSIGDKIAPTITFDFTKTNVPTTYNAASPALNADLVVKFSESVSTVLASQVTLREGDANGPVIPVTLFAGPTADFKYTFRPTRDLKEGTTYYLAFADKVVGDASNNKAAGANTTFVTKTSPTLVSSVPADNDENVNNNLSEIVLNFSENVKMNGDYVSPSSGVFVNGPIVLLNSSDVEVAHVTTAANKLVFVGSTLTAKLTWTGSFTAYSSEETYYVLIDPAIVSNVNNYLYVGIPSSKTKLNFKIKDFVNPVLASSSPLVAPARTDATKMSAALTLSFSEPVKKGTGTVSIKRVDVTTPAEVVDINSSNVSISDDGLTVSVSHSALVPSRSAATPSVVVVYEVSMNDGAIVDLAGNKFAGLVNTVAHGITTAGAEVHATATDKWYFSTANNVAPALDANASSPKNNSDKVSLTTNIVIAFDKNISVVPTTGGTKEVTLHTSTGVAQKYRMNETNVTVNGKTITVTLSSTGLLANTQYFVSLDAGAVQDIYGTPNGAIGYSGGVLNQDWKFNTNDINGPKATVVVDGVYKNPWSDGSTPLTRNVKRTSDIVINFDEAVRLAGSGSAVDGTNIPDVTGATSGTLSTGKVVQITDGTNVLDFTATISADKKTITIPASSIKYLSTGLPMTSVTNYHVIVGNVADMSTTPNNGTTLDFVFKVDDYTAPVGAYTTLDTEGSQTGNGTLGAAPAGFWVTENYKGTEIKVKFNYDEKATVYYQLLSKDASIPTVEALMANGTSVSVASVNEAVEDPTTVTIPTMAGTEYKLAVVAVDLVNATAQKLVEKQTILAADITGPSVVEYVNKDKSDVIASGGFNVQLKFADAVQKGAAGKSLYLYDSNNVLINTYDATAAALSDNDKTVTVAVAGLLDSKSYYVVIDKGFVKDASSTLPIPNRYSNPATRSVNDFAGFSVSTTYGFKTKDVTPPAISAVTPRIANALGVTASAAKADPSSNIVLTFNENVKVGADAGAGDIQIMKGGSVVSELILANSSQVSISDKVVTINPNVDFVENIAGDYRVIVKAGAFEDLAGNPNATLNWTFQVNDKVAPKVSFLVNNTTGVAINKAPIALNSNVYVEFSEVAKLLSNTDFITDDLDTLVTLVDGAKKAVKFTTTTSGSNNFTVIPTGGFASNTDYTLSFGAVFMDAAKNVVPEQTVNFTTKVGNSPTVVFDPANGTKDVATGKTITITLGRSIVQVDPTTATPGYFSTLENSELKNYLSLKVGTDNIAYNATIDATKKVITIDPVVDFDSESVISLTFNPQGINADGTANGTGNAVADEIADLVDSLNNNVIVKPVDVKTVFGTGGVVEFTVIDTKAPVLAGTKYVPNEAKYLNAGDKLAVEFSEKVKAGTGDIKIYRKDGTLVETIAASTLTTKSDNEKIILINPTVARENNTEYYVLIPSGAIVDKSPLANAFAGTVDYTSWTYSTTDNQMPVVTSLSPASGSKDVYVYDNLVINFDKKVVLGSGNIAIYKKSGDAVDLLRVSPTEYRVKLDPSQLFVTIDFTNLFAAETEFYVEVEPGTFVNAKNTDSKFAGIMTNTGWTFSTEVTNAPKVIANGLTPADNATTVSTDKLVLGMTFDREVTKGTGVVKLIETAAGTVVETVNIADAVVAGTNASITFLNPLKSGTDYHVIVEAGTVTNTLPSKVAYAGITSPTIWNFTTTTDMTAPKLVKWTPNATTTTDNDPTYELTFDETVMFGAGSLKIYKKSDNSLALTIPVTASMVNGKVVTVKNTYDATLKNGLDKNTDYYVLVDAGLVKDAAGNTSAAVTDVAAWTFKTADFATGIDNPIDNSLAFKVYPNPFESGQEVTVETSFDLTKVVVTNIAGQVVKQVVNPTGTIQLNELRSGVYFMSLYEGNKVAATVKIVKR